LFRPTRAAWNERVFFAKKMDAALAIVDKRRVEMNVAEVMNVIGEVNGRTCLTHRRPYRYSGNAGKSGAGASSERRKQWYACCTHPVLSGAAVENLVELSDHRGGGDRHDPAEPAAKQVSKIKVRSIAGLIGRAIQSIHEETSVSRLLARKVVSR